MLTHEHDVFDKDKHFLIDPDSRGIINQSKKKTLVKTDHNSEIYTFEMPRCIEGHDMTLCNVNEVHYINLGAGKDKGKTSNGLYQIEDLQVSTEDNEKVVFSWVVKGNATKYEGTLQFKIKFKCVNNNAEITYLWNTLTNKELSVGEDINNTDYVEEMYADVLAQWEQRFIEAGAVDMSNYCTKEEFNQLKEDIANGNSGLTYGIYVGNTQPTNGVMYWLDTSGDMPIEIEEDDNTSGEDTPTEPSEPNTPTEPSEKIEPVYTLANETTFDGTTTIDTGYALHDVDKNWTIVCEHSGKPTYQIPVWNCVGETLGVAMFSKSAWAWYIGIDANNYSNNNKTAIEFATGNLTNIKTVVTHIKGEETIKAYYVSNSTVTSSEYLATEYSKVIGNVANVEIGGDLSANKFLNGTTVHDFKIYERVLSDTEISTYLGV